MGSGTPGAVIRFGVQGLGLGCRFLPAFGLGLRVIGFRV